MNDRKTYKELKSKIINLGLDLQGGMYVVKEVNIEDLLMELAIKKDDLFIKTIQKTTDEVVKTDEEYLDVFSRNLKEAGANIVRYFGSRDNNTEEKILAYLRKEVKDAVSSAREVLRNRVDAYGVSEPIIQKMGEDRLIVALAGIKDIERVRELIGKTAKLEFRLLKDAEIYLTVADKINKFIQSKISPIDTLIDRETDKGKADTSGAADLEELFGRAQEPTSEGKEDTAAGKSVSLDSSSIFEEEMFFLDPYNKRTLLVPVEKKEKFEKVIALPEIQKIIQEQAGNAEFLWGSDVVHNSYYQVYLVFDTPELTGETIEESDPMPASQLDAQNIGKFMVLLNLNDEGARIFARVTGANLHKHLAIVLDNKVYLAPEIQSRIPNGRSQITGLNSMEEAKDLSIVLKAGQLKAPLKTLEERTVGPSLGKDSIDKGSASAIYGLIIVAIFMLIYYKLTGGLADLALMLNVIFIMAVMASLNATLTLPGIAGIILTIGMAVDANVLIFERIREELRRGKTIRASIDQGYSNALSAILDANITTAIAGIVLFTFGTGPIKGFATTLLIGICSSLFTAIFVTRVIFDYFVGKYPVQKLSI
jgi:SecD/SecF fusion protein